MAIYLYTVFSLMVACHGPASRSPISLSLFTSILSVISSSNDVVDFLVPWGNYVDLSTMPWSSKISLHGKPCTTAPCVFGVKHFLKAWSKVISYARTYTQLTRKAKSPLFIHFFSFSFYLSHRSFSFFPLPFNIILSLVFLFIYWFKEVNLCCRVCNRCMSA